jgi:membrane associated rhomboid family serine protease
MIIIPIRTESVIRRTPLVNYLLIAANLLSFLVFNAVAIGPLAAFKTRYLVFHAAEPMLTQFFTYQFLHADVWHLLGNMLFLWVFGNSVNAKMGNGPYLLFYLAGGVFAAWGYALIRPFPLVGASGAIAAVTTAYLALFPRSRVTVLVWLFLFIHFFELPAMVIIGLKIIVWDNIIAPNIGAQDAVAHGAHLAGYFFGFVGALGMLFVRALPRDQFDILALWKRWNQRRAFTSAMSDPAAAARARHGSVARNASGDPEQQALEDQQLDKLSDLRARIAEHVRQEDLTAATGLYEQLVTIDAQQCLSERQQLEVGREFYGSGRFPQAAAAFERFVECYSHSLEVNDVRLLLGIICARDLRRFEAADEHLTKSMTSLRDPGRRDQCLQWLQNVRAALGRPAPEGGE